MRVVGPDLHRESECEAVLRSLAAWFGIEEALLMYARDSGTLPTFGLEQSGVVVAFLTLRQHFTNSWEVHCIAVHADLRSHGLGSRLLALAERWIVQQGAKYLQVKTVAATSSSVAYAQTRMFYEHRGFEPLEVFPTLWNAHNPALLYIKLLNDAQSVHGKVDLDDVSSGSAGPRSGG